MHLVRQRHQRIGDFIGVDTPKAFWVAAALLALSLGLMAALILWRGTPAMSGYSWDSPLLLDGAWRISGGQVPHRDFYSFWGDLPLYATWLGFKMDKPCMSAIDCGNLVVMVFIGTAAMLMLRRRTSAFYAFLISLFLTLLIVTPRALGNPYDWIDHAMLYDRYGEALLALYACILFIPAKGGAPLWKWLDLVVGGLLLAALLGCKVTYFTLGVGLLFVAWATRHIGLREALACLGCAAVWLALVLTLTRIPLAPMIHDYRIMTASQRFGRRAFGVLRKGSKSIWALPVLWLLIWEVFQGESNESGRQPAMRRSILTVTAFYGAAVLLLASNSQVGETPLLAIAAFSGAEMIRRQSHSESGSSTFAVGRQLAGLLFVLVFLGPTMLADLKTTRFTMHVAATRNWFSPAALESSHLRDFRFAKDRRTLDSQAYAADLDDGIELLRRHANPQMRLCALLYSDPFEIALGLPPASGGLICFDTLALSRASHPALSFLLGNATHVLVGPDDKMARDIFGPDWDSLRLEVVEKTKGYTLFKVPEKSNPSAKVN